MPSFKFICEDEAIPFKEKTTSTLEFTATTVEEVLENLQRFLAGAGYSIEGNVQVVQDDYIGYAGRSHTMYDNISTNDFATMNDTLPIFSSSSFGNDTISFSSFGEFDKK